MTIRVQARLPMDSGLPEDAVINTFHCNVANGATEVEAATAFIDAIATAYQAFDSFMSVRIDAPNLQFKAYDLNDPEPREPIVEDLTSFSVTPGANALPPELAICLSFQGAPASGAPQARRRGRVYLGPLAQAAATDDRVASAAITAAVAMGDSLLEASKAALADFTWVVYSRVGTGTPLNPIPATFAVTNGWVDDEFDIQRRRSLAPTTRSTFS